jgi:Zn-dependent oligopeptidase
MMKNRHNKKRNVAFVYEALVNIVTTSVINKEEQERKAAINILKEFYNNTEIAKEHQIYTTILECENLDTSTAEKIIAEAKRTHDKLDKQKLFTEQTALIKSINKNLGTETFSVFVPSYKSLASVAQLFNQEATVRDRVLLEGKVIEAMTIPEAKESQKLEQIDDIVLNKFLEKFNSKYGDTLNEGQKTLLSKYISSFVDNGIELKIYLNEEVSKIRNELSDLLSNTELCDEQMSKSTKQVLSILDESKEEPINEDMLTNILKVQQLVEEIRNDD